VSNSAPASPIGEAQCRDSSAGDHELNRMKEIKQSGTTLLAKYDWDALSRRSKLTFGNTTTATYGYAANDDLASIVHKLKQSTAAFTFNYSYNKVGQRTQTSVTDDRFLFRPAANDNLAYSANNLNQYTLVGAASLSYSTNGNLTGDGVNTYGYNSENRLISWSGNSRTASYAYDPLGRRASKTVDSVTTSYLADGDREIAEYDGSGTLLRRFVYGVNLDEPLLQITRTGTKFYYRADALGSIVAHEEHASSFVQ
jgi:YD repeat-containing protein